MERAFDRVRELLNDEAWEDDEEESAPEGPPIAAVAAEAAEDDEYDLQPGAGAGAPEATAGQALAPMADPMDAPPAEVPAPERKKRIRARTISVRRMTKEELRIGRLLYPETDYEKPRSRADCANGERPCPFVSCQHHLYLDVNPETGSIKLNFPHLEVWEMTETCALDVADRGGTTLEDVGAILNLTRERIRQVEMRGLGKLRHAEEMQRLREAVEET